jgi:Ser/Thr protein kinase RdoA (MazF antagonist)
VQSAVDDHHRSDLARLAEAVPGLLARLANLPTGVCHGDATPDNFREPGDGTMVALDWSYAHMGQIGSDLAQLLVGRFETGAAEIDDIPAIADTIIDGFVEGLAVEGSTATLDDVRAAWATHLAVRSVFSALVLDHRPDLYGDARADLLRRRAAVARFGIDLALDVAYARIIPGPDRRRDPLMSKTPDPSRMAYEADEIVVADVPANPGHGD